MGIMLVVKISTYQRINPGFNFKSICTVILCKDQAEKSRVEKVMNDLSGNFYQLLNI